MPLSNWSLWWSFSLCCVVHCCGFAVLWPKLTSSCMQHLHIYGILIPFCQHNADFLICINPWYMIIMDALVPPYHKDASVWCHHSSIFVHPFLWVWCLHLCTYTSIIIIAYCTLYMHMQYVHMFTKSHFWHGMHPKWLCSFIMLNLVSEMTLPNWCIYCAAEMIMEPHRFGFPSFLFSWWQVNNILIDIVNHLSDTPVHPFYL